MEIASEQPLHCSTVSPGKQSHHMCTPTKTIRRNTTTST